MENVNMKKRTFYMSDEDTEKLKHITKSYFNTSNRLMGEAIRKLIDEKYKSLKKDTCRRIL